MDIQCTALQAQVVGFPNFQSLGGYRPLQDGFYKIFTQNPHYVARYGSSLEGICGLWVVTKWAVYVYFVDNLYYGHPRGFFSE